MITNQPSVVFNLLKKYYPHAHCALEFKSPFQLLIATILSAQCTDERVNSVTKVLFKKFPTPQKMQKALLTDLEKIVYPTGFFKNKAKNIKACSQRLVDDFGGEVPQTIDGLISLAGVGRKTANVVLGNAFGIPSGIVVDTHVARLSRRLGWVKVQNPILIEKKLIKIVPQKDWIMLSHYLIFHGRNFCKARKPDCKNCFLIDHCPQTGV